MKPPPFKPVLATLIVPFIYAMFRLFGELAVDGWGDLASRDLMLWTLYGAVFWTGLFLIFHPPMTIYVIGHELSHALFAWLQGVKVLSMELHAGGGQIEVERTNWLITLAPYFFPIYTLVILLAHVVSVHFIGISGLTHFWMLMIGLTWAFHVTFTLQMLSLRQSDIEREGVLFSASIILLFNMLVVVLWAICVVNPAWDTVFRVYWHHLTHWAVGLRALLALPG